MKNLLGLFALATMLSACVFGDEELAISYSDQQVPALLAEATSQPIDIAPINNNRPERIAVGDREERIKDHILIGYKRNAYGQELGNIITDKPVTEIFEVALETLLTTNGHTIGDESDNLVLSVDLKDLWFDYKTGLVSVEFFADVEADITLTDRRNGEVLFSETFAGRSVSKQAGGLSGTWQTITEEALADVMKQISLSEDLVEAIEESVGTEDANVAVEIGT